MEKNSYELILSAQNGNDIAMDELVKNNIALVKSIAIKFINRGIEYDDLLQIGSIGLIRAVQKFDTNFNVKFSTYAVPMIIGEIKRFIRDNGTIKVSRSLKELAYKAMKLSEQIKITKNRESTLKEIAKELNVSIDELILALDAVKSPMSLDDGLYNDENKTSIVDNLKDDSNNQEQLIDRIMLKQILSVLSKRDRQIIILRYFHDKTQSQVASALNISQVQVSRLENKILNNLKQNIV